MNQTITEVIVQGKPAEIVAEMFYDLKEEEAKDLIAKVFDKLEDAEVSEEEFETFCKKIDEKYTQK